MGDVSLPRESVSRVQLRFSRFVLGFWLILGISCGPFALKLVDHCKPLDCNEVVLPNWVPLLFLLGACMAKTCVDFVPSKLDRAHVQGFIYIIYCLHLDRAEFWQMICSSVLACFCWIASLRSLFIRGLPSSLWKAHKLMQLGNEGDISKRPSKGKRCHI